MSKIVKISVINGGSSKAPYVFEMEYSDAKELNTIIQHVRMLCNDSMIEAETDLFTQSFSHTYNQEVLMNNK